MKTIAVAALAAFTFASAALCGTIPLDSPAGNLGTSYTWCSQGACITAYGFNRQGQPADLAGVDQPYNFLPGDADNDQGLGIDNAPVCGGAPPMTISTLPGYICQSIALDIQGGESIWLAGDITSIQFAAYYAALADDWTVWGSNTLDGPKTWLFSGLDTDAHAIPGDYAYIVATGSNVLVSGVGAVPTATPEPGTLGFFVLAVCALALLWIGSELFGMRR